MKALILISLVALGFASKNTDIISAARDGQTTYIANKMAALANLKQCNKEASADIITRIRGCSL